jgi:hypothetical protein
LTDRALENAKRHRDGLVKQRDDLLKQIEKVKANITATDQFISDWYAFAGGVDSAGDTNENKTDTKPIESPSAQQTARAKNPNRTDVGRVSWELISKAGQPIPRQELFEKLASAGLQIFGKDAEMVLSTMMWRMQEHFVRLPKYGYWIRSRPYPPAGYVPGAAVEDDGEDAKVAENMIRDPASVADT